MVAIETRGDIGAFGRTLSDRLNLEELGGSYRVQIERLQGGGSGPLIKAGHLPADVDAVLVTLKKPITAEATLRFVKVISEEFCRWTIEKEHVTQRRRALVIHEEWAERNLRTILFDDVGE